MRASCERPQGGWGPSLGLQRREPGPRERHASHLQLEGADPDMRRVPTAMARAAGALGRQSGREATDQRRPE